MVFSRARDQIGGRLPGIARRHPSEQAGRRASLNKIVEAEANSASSQPGNRGSPERMEWIAMNKGDANESLLSLIGELLYKNQLLREAIASKDEAIELIINHLMSEATSTCSCGVVDQLTFVRNTVKERDVELARRRRYSFNEFCNITRYLIDSVANSIGAR